MEKCSENWTKRLNNVYMKVRFYKQCKSQKNAKYNSPLRMFKMFIKATPPAGGGTVRILYPGTPGRGASNGLTSVAS